MYKDPDKQREAGRERARRYREAHQKALLSEGVTEGMTEIMADKGRHKIVSDTEFTRLMFQARPGHVRVSKPGDADYVPQCETTRRFIASL